MTMKRLAGALLLALIWQSGLTVSAEAHGRHHRHHGARHHHYYRHHAQDAAPAPAEHSWFGGFQSDVVSAARSYIGSGPVFGRRNLWCARFMNYVLAKTGHKGTGSDMAKSFLSEPQTSMRVGAIAVMSRRGGGHVGVVSGIDPNGNPIIISGNHGNRVREAVYPRGRIIKFVSPT